MGPTRVVCVLRVAAALLRFPGRATGAALTYMQHYFRHQGLLEHHSRPSDPTLVAACLLLASKVEEVPVSNNHLINVVWLLHDLITAHHIGVSRLLAAHDLAGLPPATAAALAAINSGEQQAPVALAALLATQPSPPHPPAVMAGGAGATHSSHPQAAGATVAASGSPAPPAQPQQAPQQPASPHPAPSDSSPNLDPGVMVALHDCPALVGDVYYEAKAKLLEAEQQLLRLLQWQLAVPHPAAALMHVAAALHAPAPVLAASLAVLNDTTAFTDLLLPGWTQQHGGSSNGSVVQGEDSPRVQHARSSPGQNGCPDNMVEVQEKEVVIAVACMLVASEAMGGACRIMCRECQAASRAGGGAHAGGQHDEDGPMRGAVACEHWVGMFGVDVGLVVCVAREMVVRLAEARTLVAEMG